MQAELFVSFQWTPLSQKTAQFFNFKECGADSKSIAAVFKDVQLNCKLNARSVANNESSYHSRPLELSFRDLDSSPETEIPRSPDGRRLASVCDLQQPCTLQTHSYSSKRSPMDKATVTPIRSRFSLVQGSEKVSCVDGHTTCARLPLLRITDCSRDPCTPIRQIIKCNTRTAARDPGSTCNIRSVANLN